VWTKRGRRAVILRASHKSKDPDNRTRARALINKIEGNLLLDGMNVRLNFRDASLDQVVRPGVQTPESLELALGAAAGGTQSSSMTIPPPLLPGLLNRSNALSGGVVQEMQLDEFRSVGTLDLEPEFDVELPVAALAFDPPEATP
jgi:hypothetical protein